MSDDYSYNDFLKMQQQAIDRVREMQKKAAPPKDTSAPVSRFFPDERDEKSEQPQPRPKAEQHPPKPPQVTKVYSAKPQKKQSVFSFLSGMDSDMTLILPLLLLYCCWLFYT